MTFFKNKTFYLHEAKTTSDDLILYIYKLCLVKSTCFQPCTSTTNSKQGIARIQSQFPYSVSNLYIPMIDLPILLQEI
jgi:hypothetical protein